MIVPIAQIIAVVSRTISGAAVANAETGFSGTGLEGFPPKDSGRREQETIRNRTIERGTM
jgi:hypothetical protein